MSEPLAVPKIGMLVLSGTERPGGVPYKRSAENYQLMVKG